MNINSVFHGTIYSGPVSQIVIPKHINSKVRIFSAVTSGVNSVEIAAPEFKIYSKSEVEETGILATFYNQPLSFYDIPTLNLMTYPLQIWEDLLTKDAFTRSALNQHALWGAADHSDLEYVELSKGGPALRVNKFWKEDQNLIRGEVDILDTDNGRNIYNLTKSGSIGLSSRGTGDLLPDFKHGCRIIATDQSGVSRIVAQDEATWNRVQNDPTLRTCQITTEGFTIVDPSCYVNTSWDAVSYPACPEAEMTQIKPGDSKISEEFVEALAAYRADNPQTSQLHSFLAASAQRSKDLKNQLSALAARRH